MADVQHSALTGASLHEPKGVAAASANTVYGADGAGSGSWAKIAVANINTSSVKNVNKIYLTYSIADLNTAASYYMVVPLAGVISKIYSVIDGALATADTIITHEIANVAVTNGTITITQAGSAAGDVDSATPTAARTLTAGQALEIICDGGTSSTTKCTLTYEIDVT